MIRFAAAVGVVAATLARAGTAHAGQVLAVDDGKARMLEYYPGEGLQIQPLGNFGKANAAWSVCRSRGDTTCAPLRSLLDAMIGLAAQRGTFKAWEHYFDFEGGVPPWTSSMSQGTGIQVLSRAYALTGEAKYREEYHTLLRDILGTLCRRNGTVVYCDHEKRFTQYLALRGT